MQGVCTIGEAIVDFLPVLQYPLERYISSPYFIVGAIMVVASFFGIIIGKRQGKEIYIIVSIISGISGAITTVSSLLRQK